VKVGKGKIILKEFDLLEFFLNRLEKWSGKLTDKNKTFIFVISVSCDLEGVSRIAVGIIN
jgi:hypothetical protein